MAQNFPQNSASIDVCFRILEQIFARIIVETERGKTQEKTFFDGIMLLFFFNSTEPNSFYSSTLKSHHIVQN